MCLKKSGSWKSKNAEVTEALKNIKEGDVVENALVKATTDWGIFLDINGGMPCCMFRI